MESSLICTQTVELYLYWENLGVSLVNRRQVRSLETIEEYSGMKMHHIAGKKNVVADALTRVPTKDCFCVRPLLLDSLVPVFRATGFQTRWTKKIKMAITHQSRRIYKF